MEERKSCWPWCLLGLVGLALLGWLMSYTGKGSAKNMIDGTRSLAQEGIDSAGFTFARAEVVGSVLKIVGTAPDKANADAACKAANDKVTGRIGLPGVFSTVDCTGITYPGYEAAAPVVASTSPNKAISAAAKAELSSCQARLSAAGKSGAVGFAKNKEQILNGQDILDRVAAVAKECQKFAVEIGAHTDTGGAADRNQNLSDLRANAVRSYLINEGVGAGQLTAKGFGETKPLVNDFPNRNADVPGQPDSPLRAQNRRIEFTITALQ